MKRNYILLVTIILTCLASYAKVEHIIERGETIETIARQYGVSVADLYAANPDLKDLFFVGMAVQIPERKIKQSDVASENKVMESDLSEAGRLSEESSEKNRVILLDETDPDESSEETQESDESDWAGMISDFDRNDFFQALKSGYMLEKSKEPYFKALRLMKQGKREKAVALMEERAVDEKDTYMQKEARYQLLYYKKFNDFDYHVGVISEWDKKLKCDNKMLVFGDNILSSQAFPISYDITPKNNKNRKRIGIEDCGTAIIIGLLPLHGKINLVLSNYYAKSGAKREYNELFMTSLKELCSRSANGIPYDEELKLDESSIKVFTDMGVVGAIELDNLEPLLRNYCKPGYNGLNLNVAELYNLGTNSTDSNVAIYYLARAAMKGHVTAFKEMLLKELDFGEKEDAIALQGALATNIFKIYRIRGSGKFNMFDTSTEQILSQLEESKKKVDVYADAEREEKRRIEKEKAEKRNRELLAAQQAREQEKREKRARIFNAIGQTLNLAAQTYMAVQANKSVSTPQSANGFGKTSAYSRTTGATRGSNIEQQLNNPAYYQNVLQQVMNVSIMQMQQEQMMEHQKELAEYQQMSKYNPNLTWDEFRQIKAQAYMETNNQGLNSGGGFDSNSTSERDNGTRHSSYNTGHYKDCHMCRGSGVCSTCNGRRSVTNWGKTSECPNCLLENMRRTGKCSSCGGTGKRFTTAQ